MLRLLLTLIVFSCSSFTWSAKDKRNYKFIMQEYEPFNWTEADQFKGGMLEVVKEICANMNIICQFESLPMKRVIAMLAEGSTDGVLSLVQNSDRESYSTLSAPVIHSNMSYFAIKGSFSNIKTIKDLKGATVGTVSSSSAEKKVLEHQKQIKDLKIIPETGLPIVMNKLAAGRYGAKGLAFSNQNVFQTSLKKANLNNVEALLSTNTESFCVAFSKKKIDEAFIKNFNSEILKMKKSGRLKELLSPYNLTAATN